MTDFEYLIYFAASLIATFLITVLVSRKLIPFLKSKKMGQKILDIGPRWHKGKEGTPTMGGISFIAAAVAVGIVMAIIFSYKFGFDTVLPFILLYVYAILNGVIGFFDDLTKFRHKRNEGFTAPQKYFLQLLAAAVFLFLLRYFGVVDTMIYIPFADISVDLGIGYYILSLIVLTGFVNSVNLTDGLDGLASSVTFLVMGFFSAAAMSVRDSNVFLYSAICAGATLGFLVYNFYPAKVFMGDTGSLFLGASVSGVAVVMKNPLILIVVGFVYLCEAASVILQVGYFKISGGKRLFKMAPIHHHFEKCGLGEIQIVGLFSLVTIILSAVAYIVEYAI
ncbi:MAG: phospho-N-acetylmuramoyl-pentapeptide-transferase [Clostridia bacterium]|nr:phospho-N-acetylmuramoyl-pentapeptide-transferase [Clostridia bacterium]